jgi:hypothetical protein
MLLEREVATAEDGCGISTTCYLNIPFITRGNRMVFVYFYLTDEMLHGKKLQEIVLRSSVSKEATWSLSLMNEK